MGREFWWGSLIKFLAYATNRWTDFNAARLRTTKDIKKRARELCVEHAEQGLPPPTYQEQVTRKEGSGAIPKLSEADIERLLEACTIDKKARKKLWIQVAREEGFFNLH